MVIKWIKSIVFYMESFYPFIFLDFCNKAIKFRSTIKPIADNDIKIIIQSRETLLFLGNELWIKRSDN